jgi:hypothetical protein
MRVALISFVLVQLVAFVLSANPGTLVLLSGLLVDVHIINIIVLFCFQNLPLTWALFACRSA